MPKALWKLPSETINWQQKHLLSLIWFCGFKGCICWDSVLADKFGVTPRTIRRWLAHLKKLDLIVIGFPGGSKRIIWSKTPPKNLEKSLLANL